MAMVKETKNKNRAWMLIFLGWLVYTVSYFGKVNYSANITQIIDFYNVSKMQAGAVPTFFFCSYGIGQVVNGLLCKKYNVKWMIFASLIISAVTNLIVAISSDFAIIKWLWLINGFCLSVLWPTLVRLLSDALPKKSLGASSVIMGTTVACGTLVIYALSSLYATFDKFKFSFYTASFAVIIVAFIWLALYKKAVSGAKSEKEGEAAEIEEELKTPLQKTAEKNQRTLLYVTVGVLCFCAIGVNLIKDGLTTWVPSILKEEFSMSDSLSILLTLFLPILAVFANASALKLHKMMPDYINHCTATFGVIVAFIGLIIASLEFELVLPMLIGLIVVNFLASSLNSLLTSIYPLFMRDKINSGLIAGVINGFCYIGSAISSFGLGAVADSFGWVGTFAVLIGFCLVVVIVWIVFTIIKAFLKKKNI